MIKELYNVLFSVAATTGITLCQTSCSAGSTNWGMAVHGSQLSIISTNNVAKSGSTLTVTERIRNRSQDAIWIYSPGTNSYLLTNQLGNTYYLQPYHGSYPSSTINEWPKTVFPGETNGWTIELKIGKEIKPATYQLIAVRRFMVETNHNYVSPGVLMVSPGTTLTSGPQSRATETKPIYNLTSNPLETQVVK